eukprot:c6937_g1_i1.p1 GENE.c6937_g1_i1~~c6937_g1_i1.p1  ORF type:complete len:535 (+),score=144.68 c6937_g1_i1:46-1605(+)
MENQDTQSVASSRPSSPLLTNPKRTLNTRVVMTLTFFASVGGALFGYDTGVVSGALPLVSAHHDECPKYNGFGLSNIEKEAFVDATIGGAVIGSALSGFFCDKYGRRPVIMFGAVLFTLGSVLLGLANSFGLLVVGRTVVGLAIGFASHTTPMYLAEVAPPKIRGQLVSTFNVFIVAGQVFAGVVDGAFFYLHSGWRYMLGFAAFLSILQFVGFMFLPESPRWLTKQNRVDEATTILKHIRGSNEVQQELDEIFSSLHGDHEQISWKEIFSTQSIRRPMLLGCFLMFLQQFVGINTVMYYSATILQEAGFGGGDSICCCSKDSIPIWLSSVTALSQFFGCITGMMLADRVGRRPLLLCSLAGVFVMLGVLGLGYVVHFEDTLRKVILMLGLIGYLLCFGVGMSPVPWIMNSELYPLRARSRCASAAVAVNWISNFVVAGTFLSLTKAIGTGETFWLFGVIAVAGWVSLFFIMPETFGLSLEQIETMFESNSSLVRPHKVTGKSALSLSEAATTTTTDFN